MLWLRRPVTASCGLFGDRAKKYFFARQQRKNGMLIPIRWNTKINWLNRGVRHCLVMNKKLFEDEQRFV